MAPCNHRRTGRRWQEKYRHEKKEEREKEVRRMRLSICYTILYSIACTSLSQKDSHTRPARPCPLYTQYCGFMRRSNTYVHRLEGNLWPDKQVPLACHLNSNYMHTLLPWQPMRRWNCLKVFLHGFSQCAL